MLRLRFHVLRAISVNHRGSAHPSCGMEGQRNGWRNYLSPPSTGGGAICHNDQAIEARTIFPRMRISNRSACCPCRGHDFAPHDTAFFHALPHRFRIEDIMSCGHQGHLGWNLHHRYREWQRYPLAAATYSDVRSATTAKGGNPRGARIRDRGSGFADPGSGIRDPGKVGVGSGSRDPGSGQGWGRLGVWGVGVGDWDSPPPCGMRDGPTVLVRSPSD